MVLSRSGCSLRCLSVRYYGPFQQASVFGVLVLGSSELGVSFVLCFIFRAVGFRVLCWVLGSS